MQHVNTTKDGYVICPERGAHCTGHDWKENGDGSRSRCAWAWKHQIVPFERSGGDLETPSGAPVDSGATDEPEGAQIFEPDPVNSPAHYRQYPIEVIEITEQLGFLLGNVIKYVLRADYKGKPLEDLRKAEWYLKREIANRERDTP